MSLAIVNSHWVEETSSGVPHEFLVWMMSIIVRCYPAFEVPAVSKLAFRAVGARATVALAVWVKKTREVSMVRFQSGLISILLFGMAASAATAEEVWSLDGFKAPESALLDSQRGVIYVSNIVGEPNAKDGVGFISKVTPDGKMQEAEWVKGLNAPKGLVMSGDKLYVSDIDQLVEIDVNSGKVTNTWDAKGAQFLNDTAVDSDGRIYVSDMLTDSIYVMESGALSVWLHDAALMHPNGLRVEDGRLLVAAWGKDIQPDFTTKEPGRLLAIDLKSKKISAVGSGEPVGNLDGLEPDGAGNWLVTDWVGGALYRLHPDGTSDQLIDLNQGSADLEYDETKKLAIIPMMMDGKLVAISVK
jgi:sugar lactone lactonase YvrE